MEKSWRVADAIRACWQRYNATHALPPHVAQSVGNILRCRTAVLGGHLYQCEQCGTRIPLYNSCKDRHCPSCQGIERKKWLDRRMRELLPIPYFHVVFTLPHVLNDLVNANRKLLLGEFFTTVNWVLQKFAHDPQWRLEGELGFIAVLHTWNQRLGLHYHTHCLVPGGGYRRQTKEFIVCNQNWLFRKDSLAKAFQNRFLKRLRALRKRGCLAYGGPSEALAGDEPWNAMLHSLEQAAWIVYPKKVPATPEKALEYLARYTHRVAISDYRVQHVHEGTVTYTWLDRNDQNRQKPDTIPVEEFTRRFLQHILPPRFKKIRFFGWMRNADRIPALSAIREILHVSRLAPKEEKNDEPRLHTCPICSKGRLFPIEAIFPRSQSP